MKDSKTTKSAASKKAYNKSSEKVKVTKVSPSDDNFLDDDNDDKKLIVFIAVAILVIIGTIIGLLVGCQKEEEPEPENPNDDIVVPIDNDQGKESNEGVVTKEVVRKVTAVTNSNSDLTDDEEGESDDEGEEEESTTYTVTYVVYTEESDVPNSVETEVEEGATAESEVAGYTDCEFATEDDEEFDFETPITEDTTIYAYCSLVHYTIQYETDGMDNPNTTTEYTVEDGTIPLEDLDVSPFHGWFMTYDSETEDYTDQVDSISPELVNYADGSNNIIIYASFGLKDGTMEVEEMYAITFLDESGEAIDYDAASMEEGSTYDLPTTMDYCPSGACAGFIDASDPEGPIIEPGTTISITSSMEFIVICDAVADDDNESLEEDDEVLGVACDPELDICDEVEDDDESLNTDDNLGEDNTCDPEVENCDNENNNEEDDGDDDTVGQDNDTGNDDACDPELDNCNDGNDDDDDNATNLDSTDDESGKQDNDENGEDGESEEPEPDPEPTPEPEPEPEPTPEHEPEPQPEPTPEPEPNE